MFSFLTAGGVKWAVALVLSGAAVVGVKKFMDEHDARVHAEDRAKQIASEDKLTIAKWKAVVDSQVAHVDTQRVLTTNLINRTITKIDTARERITDTLYVRQTLEQADTALHGCTERLHDCARIQTALRFTIDSLANLVVSRDTDRVNYVAPRPAPRFSHGIQAGGGYCKGFAGTQGWCGYAGYGFQFRFP